MLEAVAEQQPRRLADGERGQGQGRRPPSRSGLGPHAAGASALGLDMFRGHPSDALRCFVALRFGWVWVLTQLAKKKEVES